MKTVTVFLAATALTLVVSAYTSTRAQQGTLAGVAGQPVEGHEILGSLQFSGTKHLDYETVRKRVEADGIILRPGRPIESQNLCRLKEVVRDMMMEKGFVNAEITYEITSAGPAHPSNAVKLSIKIAEGERTGRPKSTGLMSPAERCAR